MELIQIVTGGLLISYGKKIVWLMVTTIVFLSCQLILPILFPAKEDAVILVLAIIIAGFATICVIYIKRLALLVGGFLGGGYFFLNFSAYIPIEQTTPLPTWIMFLIGGLLGILISFMLFNWLIMILSSFAGSVLILQVFPLPPLMRLFLTIPLCILGTYLQTQLTSSKPHTKPV